MKLSNKGFSFVEILIVVTILAVISIIASTAYSSMQTKSTNAKVVSDLRAINNSLESYSKENQALPMPKGNLNYYKEDTSYSHNLENSFGVSGYFFEGVLPKKYLSYLPYDPKTSQLYAYAKTNKQLAYEVGGVIYENELPVSVVMGNWGGEYGPYNLIKEYSGPNFVSEGSKNYFPYNPYEKRLVAKINSFSGTLKIDDVEKTLSQISDLELIAGNKIEISAGGFAEIYISDGSSTIIGDKDNISTLELQNFNFKDNTNIFTSVKLALLNGSVWTKAAKLDNNSSFEVSTPDTVAAVRGTIFGVTKNAGSSQVTLIEGKIDVKDNNNTPKEELQVNFGDTPKGVIIEGSVLNSGTGNISNIPDEVKDKAMTGIADFNENIQLKILSKTGSTLEIELNDITTKFNKLFVDEKEIESSKYSKNENILSIMNLDFSKVNKIKLCKDSLCSKTLELSPLDSNLSFNDISKKDKILALNDPDNIEVEDLEEVKSEIEKKKYIENNIGDKFFRQYLYGDYQIVGYAPYDEAGDLNMYTNSSIITPNSGVIINNSCYPKLDNGLFKECMSYYSYPSGISYNSYNSFFNYKGIKGIFIDNKSYDDYLSYTSDLFSKQSFAIEIGVRGKALKRDDKHYLFYNYRNSLYIDSGILKMNGNKLDLSRLEDDKSYSIIVKFEPSNIELSIRDYEGNIIDSTSALGAYTLDNEIYIGAEKGYRIYLNQWNDIIDYVKIYKKDLLTPTALPATNNP